MCVYTCKDMLAIYGICVKTENVEKIFAKLIQENDEEIVREHLRTLNRHKDLDYSVDGNELVRLCAIYNATMLLSFLVIQTRWNARLNLGAHDNIAFLHAVKNGNVEVVKHLLVISGVDKRVNPGHCNNKFIAVAAQYGHVEIVQLLLEASKTDFRINPGDSDNCALRNAVMNNHPRTALVLLEASKTDTRIDVRKYHDVIMTWAIMNNYTNITNMMSEVSSNTESTEREPERCSWMQIAMQNRNIILIETLMRKMYANKDYDEIEMVISDIKSNWWIRNHIFYGSVDRNVILKTIAEYYVQKGNVEFEDVKWFIDIVVCVHNISGNDSFLQTVVTAMMPLVSSMDSVKSLLYQHPPMLTVVLQYAAEHDATIFSDEDVHCLYTHYIGDSSWKHKSVVNILLDMYIHRVPVDDVVRTANMLNDHKEWYKKKTLIDAVRSRLTAEHLRTTCQNVSLFSPQELLRYYSDIIEDDDVKRIMQQSLPTDMLHRYKEFKRVRQTMSVMDVLDMYIKSKTCYVKNDRTFDMDYLSKFMKHYMSDIRPHVMTAHPFIRKCYLHKLSEYMTTEHANMFLQDVRVTRFPADFLNDFNNKFDHDILNNRVACESRPRCLYNILQVCHDRVNMSIVYDKIRNERKTRVLRPFLKYCGDRVTDMSAVQQRCETDKYHSFTYLLVEYFWEKLPCTIIKPCVGLVRAGDALYQNIFLKCAHLYSPEELHKMFLGIENVDTISTILDHTSYVPSKEAVQLKLKTATGSIVKFLIEKYPSYVPNANIKARLLAQDGYHFLRKLIDDQSTLLTTDVVNTVLCYSNDVRVKRDLLTYILSELQDTVIPESDEYTDIPDNECTVCTTHHVKLSLSCSPMHKLCVSCVKTINLSNNGRKCPFCREPIQYVTVL